MKLVAVAPNMTKLVIPIANSMYPIEVCFSYDTPIVAFNHQQERVYLLDRKISKTTTTHLNKFLSASESVTEGYGQSHVDDEHMSSLLQHTLAPEVAHNL